MIALFAHLQTEMSCCRRIVQLCRDCLLIVYQFAADAKAAGAASVLSQSSPHDQDVDTRSVLKFELLQEQLVLLCFFQIETNPEK